MKLIIRYTTICILFLGLYACNSSSDSPPKNEKTDNVQIPKYLPYQTINLDNLEAFEKPGANWKIVGNVTSLFEEKHSLQTEEGKGVLVNLSNSPEASSLQTQLEHGDLELKLEYLCPKNARSQILFQGRYALQLADDSESSVMPPNGTIISHKSTEDNPIKAFVSPSMDANRASGLWQTLHVLFRAPRFDENGKKIKNAAIEYALINDMSIQKNIEFKAPSTFSLSDDEVQKGPLSFLDEKSPMAFRNIQYKLYSDEHLSIGELTCNVYHGEWDYIPDFTKLEAVKKQTGITEFNNFDDISGQAKHYALQFEGELIVPKSGEYLFETSIDDGGDLKIDDQLVVHNEGEPGIGTERGIVNLTEGKHKIEVTYYEEVWASTLIIHYEGPEMERQTLASGIKKTDSDAQNVKKPKPLLIQPENSTEVFRSFVEYQGVKKTHAISVGSPVGVHYSYDLLEGALLKAWKGEFADVTEMWQGRGEPQLLEPLNAVIETEDGISWAKLDQENGEWPTQIPEGFKYKGYKIADDDHPIFLYNLDNIQIEDDFTPNQEKQLVRTLRFNADQKQNNYWYKLAKADFIKKLDNGWYSIGQKYYLKILNQGEAKEKVREYTGYQDLIIPILNSNSASEIQIAIFW